jgi:hypothetical protein
MPARVKIFSAVSMVLLLFVLVSGCASKNDLNSRVNRAAAPYRFSLFKWEVKALAGELKDTFTRDSDADTTASLEKRIEGQIRKVLSEQGIYNPADRFFKLKVGFPPVTLYLGDPPHLMVVSPRDKIADVAEVTLLPDMSEPDMATVETRVEKLGYSALVVELGGMATFPSYVSNDADMKFIIESAAHEWVHQYLAFTPLGFLYVLDKTGLRADYDVATINETVADIVGKEIGDVVYQKFYTMAGTDNVTPSPGSGFDFNGAMRQIRLTVDAYLAQGQIAAAEDYMNERRQYLADHGYIIRKLNQAYFAFYGTYADSPASVSPIGQELQTLRNRSVSVKQFLDTVAPITSRDRLDKSVR